jgi:hypothetical protein
MAVEYIQVRPGVLRKGDIVHEVVRFNHDQVKYIQGKVVQLLGGKVALVKLVNGKSARIPFKNLVIGAGLYEARTNPNSSRMERLEKFNSTVCISTVTTPVVIDPVVTEPVVTALTSPDDFGAWLSIGVDFLPVLEKRIADREAELANTETTMAAVLEEQRVRVAALEAQLLAEREALVLSFAEKRSQLEGWRNVLALLQPLASLAGK